MHTTRNALEDKRVGTISYWDQDQKLLQGQETKKNPNTEHEKTRSVSVKNAERSMKGRQSLASEGTSRKGLRPNKKGVLAPEASGSNLMNVFNAREGRSKNGAPASYVFSSLATVGTKSHRRPEV